MRSGTPPEQEFLVIYKLKASESIQVGKKFDLSKNAASLFYLNTRREADKLAKHTQDKNIFWALDATKQEAKSMQDQNVLSVEEKIRDFVMDCAFIHGNHERGRVLATMVNKLGLVSWLATELYRLTDLISARSDYYMDNLIKTKISDYPTLHDFLNTIDISTINVLQDEHDVVDKIYQHYQQQQAGGSGSGQPEGVLANVQAYVGGAAAQVVDASDVYVVAADQVGGAGGAVSGGEVSGAVAGAVAVAGAAAQGQQQQQPATDAAGSSASSLRAAATDAASAAAASSASVLRAQASEYVQDMDLDPIIFGSESSLSSFSHTSPSPPGKGKGRADTIYIDTPIPEDIGSSVLQGRADTLHMDIDNDSSVLHPLLPPRRLPHTLSLPPLFRAVPTAAAPTTTTTAAAPASTTTATSSTTTTTTASAATTATAAAAATGRPTRTKRKTHSTSPYICTTPQPPR